MSAHSAAGDGAKREPGSAAGTAEPDLSRRAKSPSSLPSAILAILLGVTLALAGFAFAQFRDADRWVEHTEDVKLAIRDVLSAVLDAETGTRGYIITQSADFLEPYRAGLRGGDEAVARVRSLIADNPAQMRRVDEVERVVRARLDVMRQRIEVRDREGFVAAAKLLQTGEGQHLTDMLRGQLSEMNAAEDKLFEMRRRARQRDAALTLTALTLASACFGLLLVNGFARRRVDKERERTAEFQEKFVGVVGHDLRSPLAAIETTVQVLQRTTGPEQAAALRRMETSCGRMGRMIDQLLDLTRIRLGGGIRVVPKRQDLTQVVHAIVEEQRGANPQNSIQLEEHGRVDGSWDADRLGQVVSNLLGNALAYRTPGTPVRAALEARNDVAVLTVHNDGPPIPKDVMPTLFDPFRRGQRRQPPSGGGLGLGLFITKAMVEAHRGVIEVQTNDGTGTTFKVTLPRRATGRVGRPEESTGARGWLVRLAPRARDRFA
jgi:signal transduction histidine kinase